MKKILSALAGILLVLASCERSDSDTDFGIASIYMPQATIAGLRYNVPNTGIGLDSATRNYLLTNDSVKIMLGVLRSGEQPSEGYTVNVRANADTAAQLISSGVFPSATATVLPTAIYSLPQTVVVANGKVETTFYLAIHRSKLKALAGKTLLLGVGLSDPDRYILNNAISKVLVIINATALNL
jgi:hypothetical protein